MLMGLLVWLSVIFGVSVASDSSKGLLDTANIVKATFLPELAILRPILLQKPALFSYLALMSKAREIALEKSYLVTEANFEVDTSYLRALFNNVS
jgi:hypothetical protein